MYCKQHLGISRVRSFTCHYALLTALRDLGCRKFYLPLCTVNSIKGPRGSEVPTRNLSLLDQIYKTFVESFTRSVKRSFLFDYNEILTSIEWYTYWNRYYFKQQSPLLIPTSILLNRWIRLMLLWSLFWNVFKNLHHMTPNMILPVLDILLEVGHAWGTAILFSRPNLPTLNLSLWNQVFLVE